MEEIRNTLVGFDYLDTDELTELQKNIDTLFATPAGTIPGDRSFGISRESVSKPRPIVENLLTLEVMEKLEIYVPQVVVEDVEFGTDENGALTALFYLCPNEDYDEDDEEAEDDDDDIDGEEE